MLQKPHTDGGQYHTPVLLQEAIDALQIDPGGTYVDCTFGGGGHSSQILARLQPQGRLVAFDQDAAAAANVPAGDERLLFVPHNFRYLARFLRFHGVGAVDGILADLGVSSHQFNEGERGFSTRFDALLDMRMDRRQPRTAADVLNQTGEAALQQMFSSYGEVTNARTLAKHIVAARQVAPFSTIQAFKESLAELVKGNPQKYFAQVFQAIRMEVNEEMQSLAEMLEQTTEVLKPGGRLAVITFHSVEDRMVKNFMKHGSVHELEADDIYGTRAASPFRLITRKPVVASQTEQQTNKRSRSAKLRVAEKI